jgi:hypothetical protein
MPDVHDNNEIPEQLLREAFATPPLPEALREKLLHIPGQHTQAPATHTPGWRWPLWLIASSGLATACAVLGFVAGTQGLFSPDYSLDWAALAYGSI